MVGKKGYFRLGGNLVRYLSSLLLGDTDRSSLSSRGLRVLTPHSHSPLMSQPSMISDFLESLEIITELGVERGGDHLGKFTVFDVLLSVEEPIWDLVLLRMLDHCHKALDLIRRKLSGSLVHINVCSLADKIGKSSTATLDVGESKHHLLAAINVGSENSENVLEIVGLNEGH